MPRRRTHSGDAGVRELARACAAAPRDQALWARLARALERAGQATAHAWRVDYATALIRTGRQAEAAPLLGIRWEADPARLAGQLAWKDARLGGAELEALVDVDLRLIDPLRLLAHFPRTKDGELRLNVTRYLARYRAHERGQHYRRLVLLAWTPGTATLWDRPDDRGQRAITIGLETRSARGRMLEPKLWREA